MIVLRQKEFGFGGFDWAFDSEGNLRTDLTEEDQRKFEVMKKKHPQEWEEFQRRQKEKKSRSSQDSDQYYGDYGYGPTSDEQIKNMGKWYQRKRASRAISYGAWAADLINTGIKSEVRKSRKKGIDSIVGRDKRMKRLDRLEIDDLKYKSDKSKKALHDSIDENKTTEEREKASKKYVRRESLDKTSDGLLRGADIGSSIGRLSGIGKELMNGGDYGKSEITGTLVGTGIGASVGALRSGLKARKASKKFLEHLKNSEDKEKAKDKIKVARGKMTESEYVEKHGGKDK